MLGTLLGLAVRTFAAKTFDGLEAGTRRLWVAGFYRALAESPELAASYRQVALSNPTGFEVAKIVVFAEAVGYRFLAADLEYVRLTNINDGDVDEVDLQPTRYPHPPASPERFRAAHGRDVYNR